MSKIHEGDAFDRSKSINIQENKISKRWYQHDLARLFHAAVLLVATETGCAGSLRFEHRGFPRQAGVIELSSDEEQRLIPNEIGPERMAEERARVISKLQEMGVDGLDRIQDRPINYSAISGDLNMSGGELSFEREEMDILVPVSYLTRPAGPGHERVAADVRATVRHEFLHGVALDLRNTQEERDSYKRGVVETTDPLAVGTDLHEAMTVFLANALSQESDPLDGTYFYGQELVLLCAEGLRRDGVSDPVAFIAKTYFNGGKDGWTSLVERSGRSLVQAGLIRDAHDLQVAINRLPDADTLARGSESALRSRVETFESQTGYDLERLPRDARELGDQIKLFASFPSSQR
ncbi:MAG: hypothetical protein WCK01_04445 [Candidatus Uhrbacteria bacterium]